MGHRRQGGSPSPVALSMVKAKTHRQPAKRSSIETILNQAFEARGLPAWEREPLKVVGKPDFVWRDGLIRPLAVFADGCYWHACPKHYREHKGKRRKSWALKTQKTQIRDRGTAWRCAHCGEYTGLLVERGWEVLRFWECEIKADGGAARIAREVEVKLDELARKRTTNAQALRTGD